MRSLRLTVLAALLAAGTASAQAGEIRLDDAQLDHVTAGIVLPTSPLLAQVPGLLAANNAHWMLIFVQPVAEAFQGGGPFGGLFGGGLLSRLPLGLRGR